MAFEELIREHYHTPADMEKVLLLLRQAGADPLQTVKLLMDTLGFPLKEADRIVLLSETWRDQRSAMVDLQNAWFDALEGKT